MVAFNTDSLCREAEAHYFDFLLEGEPDSVPRHIIDHVRGCRHCRAGIEQLGSVLAQTRSSSATSQINAAISTMLKLHFAYLGQPVTCKTVKPFLPTLLDPTLEIRIPTPIIVHLDRCEECSQDLEKIRDMNLSRGQLCRLSQMFADKPMDKYIACPKAQAAVNPVVNLSLHKTNVDILKHLCLCPFCRELVFEARKFAIKLLPESKEGNESLLCSQVSPGDIFDYAVPYGLDPASDQYANFRESLAAHILKCRTCIGKIQELHGIIYGIAERAESGVVTTYEVDASATETHTNLYAGFPIKVEAAGELSTAKPVAPDRPVARRRVWTRHLKPFAAVSAVAAALIVTVIVLLSSPVAKAVTIDQIYRALELAKNVYVASFLPGIPKPTQEKWVSRSLGIYMTSTSDELVLWDLNRAIRKAHTNGTDKTKQVSLSSEETARIETTISGSLGLMPFEDMSQLPKDAQWCRLADASLPGDTSVLEVYDLLWTEKRYSGLSVFNRWRVFVNPDTNLPRRTEFYQMSPGEQEYVLKLSKIVEYLEDNEIQTVVEKLAF
jgi:hypothetical protein